jgi:hypothetical protein
LQESNLDRARQDGLDVARVMQAVERIGAAFVFGRKETIAVPDGEIDLALETSFDIADILPDWSPHDRIALLGRAVFDPATLGRARRSSRRAADLRCCCGPSPRPAIPS